MKTKKLIRFFLLVGILTPMTILFLTSSGSSKEVGGKKGPSDLTPIGCNITEKETTLLLYQNLPTPNIRLNNWAVPQMPSLWAGNISATSLYDSPNTKYYCLITVATTCTTYGQGGAKTYVWNSPNKNNAMKIKVPDNTQFRISVEYYEKCGPFWTGGPTYGRGKWYSELTVGYSPQLAITSWAWLIKENC